MQIIHFNKIYFNKNSIQTLAIGNIPKTENFRFSNEFSYYGNMKLEANRKDLEFSGNVKLNSECTHRLKHPWFKFTAIINKDSIVIPIENVTKNDGETELFSGYYLLKIL